MPADETAAKPYCAVIFTSTLRPEVNPDEYRQAVTNMLTLGTRQPGFLGIESVRGADGKGITLVLYDRAEAIDAWAANLDHRAAKRRGRAEFYQEYEIRFATVHRGHHWSRDS